MPYWYLVYNLPHGETVHDHTEPYLPSLFIMVVAIAICSDGLAREITKISVVFNTERTPFIKFKNAGKKRPPIYMVSLCKPEVSFFINTK